MHPDTLYKYRSLDGESKEWVENIFTKSEIYFSSPNGFNDPFDCKVELSLDGTDEEWRKYESGLIKRNNPDISPAKRLILSRKISRSKAIRNNLNQRSITGLMGNIGVYSLSSVRDDILMWSHYADSHKGICIGFHADEASVFFREAQPVIYSKEYPHARLIDRTIERMSAMILTKSDHWNYEKEYRLINTHEGYGIKNFPAKSLKEIIFGCEISQENLKYFIELVRDHPARPKIYKASKANKEFKLDICEIA